MLRYIFISLSIVLLASCRVIQPNKMFQVPENYKYTDFKASQKEYIIQPFDKLNMQVFTNDGIKMLSPERTGNMNNNINQFEYLVEYNGVVNIPVLGRVKIDGLTLKEAEEMLEEKYSKYYQKPYIKISVTNRRVIVFSGGSENGQVIPLNEENYTLIEALAVAGGISDFSKAYSIRLIRGDLNNPEIYLFSLAKISDFKNVNFLLEANDIIYVETKPRYASRIITEISPYLSFITTVVLISQLFNNP